MLASISLRLERRMHGLVIIIKVCILHFNQDQAVKDH